MLPTRFRLEEFFDGPVRCWGLFEDPFRTVRRHFVIDIAGRWDGKALTLHEDYRYDDGETGTRDWSITPTGPDGYVGVSPDVVGSAVGRVTGNAFRWRYAMNIRFGEKIWPMRFDDRLILEPDGTLINRAYMGRWGIPFGSVTAVFRRI